MTRTFIRQSTQIKNSDNYDDSLAPGASLETQTSIEGDLNALRSMASLLKSNQAGNWYDDLATPSAFEGGAKRGVDSLNEDLHDLERKRVLVLDSKLDDIVVEGVPDINYIDAPIPTVGATNFTVGSGGDFPDLATALASPTVTTGAVLEILGTLAVTASIDVNKGVTIKGSAGGQYWASPTFTTDSDIGGAILNITTTDQVIVATCKFVQQAGSAGDGCIKVSANNAVRIHFCTFDTPLTAVTVETDSVWTMTDSFVYSSTGTDPMVRVLKTTNQGFIERTTIGADTNRIFLLLDGELGGYLRVNASGSGNFFGPAAFSSFIQFDSFTPAASQLEMVVDHCEIQGPPGNWPAFYAKYCDRVINFNAPETAALLSQMSSLAIVSNSARNGFFAGANAAGFVHLGADRSGTENSGTTEFFYLDNVLLSNTLDFPSAIDGETDADLLAAMTYDAAKWNDPNQTISGGSLVNYVVLSAAQLPTSTTAAIGAVDTLGTVAATNATFGAHSMDAVSGASAINPKNLCVVVDGATRDKILSGGRVVYALMQTESSTNGSTISGTTPNRAQLSFVRINAAGNALEACPVGDINGKTVNVAFVRRRPLDELDEQDFLHGAKIDVPAAIVATRQLAYDTQGATAVSVATNATLDLDAAGIEWAIRDDGDQKLFGILEGSAGGTSKVSIYGATDILDVDALAVDFASGLTVDSGSASPIQIGLTDGQIATSAGDLSLVGANGLNLESSAADLKLKAASAMMLVDGNQAGSTWSDADGIALSSASADWDNFETAYGEVSLLGALVAAKNVSARGTKTYVELGADVTAGDNVNLGVDMSGGDFSSSFDVYLNGQLMRPGADSSADHDYYPGDDLSLGQLKFEFDLETGDKLVVISYN